MKTVVWNYKTKSVIAFAESENEAHGIAECVSYMRYGNAIYGLFQIGLVCVEDLQELRRR